jgi:hypothetical protein
MAAVPHSPDHNQQTPSTKGRPMHNQTTTAPVARHAMLRTALGLQEFFARGVSHRSERGEGIVSVAIAVLIMAALGVVAYGAFDALFNNTTTAAESQISSIGG